MKRGTPRTRTIGQPLLIVAVCAVLLIVTFDAPLLGTANSKGTSTGAGSPASGLQPAIETLHNWAGYLGNTTIYPTLYTNKTFLPPLVSMTGSIQNPSGTCPISGYTDCAWPNNVVTVNTSAGSTSAASWYWNEGSPDWNFQLSLDAASSGESQYYETSCPEQNNTCYAPYAILLSTALQDLGATISGVPSGFSTNFVSGVEGLNMTLGNTPNPDGSESSGATVAAVSGSLDMAAIACAVLVPPPFDAACLVFPLADAIYDAYYLLTNSQPTNVLSDQFNPVNNGVLRQFEQTENGNPLNASSGQYCVPPASWRYPHPNPCEPTSAQRNSSIGQNTFSQSLQLNTLTGDLSRKNAQALLAKAAGTISLWSQNYVEAWEYCITGCFSPYSFYSNLYNPGANASISYPFAQASSISGTVLSGVGNHTPVGGATVYISQSCGPSTSPVTTLFTETAGATGTNAVGTWHFFADPLCNYTYWAQNTGPFGSVNSAVITLLNPPAGGQVNTTGLALDNYGVTIGSSGWDYGTQWSATLKLISGGPSSTESTSDSASLTFYVPNGSYSYAITPPLGATSSPPSNIFEVNGVNQTIRITFTYGLRIDGYDENAINTDTEFINTTLTTTNPNDLIVAFVDSSGFWPALACSDSADLSWHTAVLFEGGSGGLASSGFDYARAANPLTSDTITCGFDTASDPMNIVVFGISGTNLTSPLDPTDDNPPTASGVGSSPSVSINTADSNDMLLGAIVSTGQGTVIPEPPFGAVVDSVGTSWSSGAEYEVVGSAGTYQVSYQGTYGDWVLMALAISAPTPSTYGVVSEAYVATSSTNTAKSLTSPAFETYAGDLIVVSTADYTSGTAVTVSDSEGNTWISLGNHESSSKLWADGFYTIAGSTGSDTLTLSDTTSSEMCGEIVVYGGLGTAVTAGAWTDSTSTTDTPSVTTTAGATVVALYSADRYTGPVTASGYMESAGGVDSNDIYAQQFWSTPFASASTGTTSVTFTQATATQHSIMLLSVGYVFSQAEATTPVNTTTPETSVTSPTFQTHAGDLIVVSTADYTSGTAVTVSDSEGNTWTSVGNHESGTTLWADGFYAVAKSTGSDTLTLKDTTSSQMAADIVVYSSFGTIVTTGSWTDSATTSDTPSVTTLAGATVIALYSAVRYTGVVTAPGYTESLFGNFPYNIYAIQFWDNSFASASLGTTSVTFTQATATQHSIMLLSVT